MRVDFCLPIKDEADILEKNILQLILYLESKNFSFTWKIIGVINGSNDNSELILANLKEKLPTKIDYLNIQEPGKGRAIRTGWYNSEADILAFMDADLAVSLEALNSLIEPILNKEADLVIGSRFVPGASASRSWRRGLISKSYILLSQFILHHKILDIQCGFKAISKDSFRKLDNLLTDDNWFFDTELVVLAKRMGLRVREIAVTWTENRVGSKKSNIRIISDSWRFLKCLLVFRRRLKTLKNIGVVLD